MATTMMPQEAYALREVARIRQDMANYGLPRGDAQEQAERQEAAQAYAGESPMHFVHYVDECVRTSAQAQRDVRLMQRQCWDVYQEKEPPNYTAKELWQSRAMLPKPYSAVQFAVAAVQAAFSPTFLSIKDEPSDTVSMFWTKLMERQLSQQYANFIIRFTDASEMAFAVGQSLEMIPIWDEQRGSLTYSLIEPWKIYRDPDALNREPQSGMYWIHEEWMDWHVLLHGEANGQFINTKDLRNADSQHGTTQNPLGDRNTQARLRNQVHQRNRYRHAILTREFWGNVLSPRGELLMDRARFTVAGGQVIAPPVPSPYKTLRWPGVGFSPLPHLLRFDGRSLLQSVCSLWYYMCNLLCMHADYQNWIVNPMREINVRGLVDQDDTSAYPGKTYLTRDTVSGNQVVRNVENRHISGDVMSTEGWLDQVFQRGTMVNDVVQGLPGYRQEITARESAQNLAQSQTAFSKMGANAEAGAIQAILAGMETIALSIDQRRVLQVFTVPQLVEMFGERDGRPAIFASDGKAVEIPELAGNIHVSGLQNLLQDTQELAAIERLVLPLAMHPIFGQYFKKYKVANAIITRANLDDEGLIVNEAEAAAFQEQESAAAKEQLAIQQKLMQLQIAMLEQKMSLDERKQKLDEDVAALEEERARAELLLSAGQQGEAPMTPQEREKLEAEVAKIAADIAVAMEGIQRDRAKLILDAAKVDGTLEKIRASIDLEQQKLQLEQQRVDNEARQLAIMARRPVGGSNG